MGQTTPLLSARGIRIEQVHKAYGSQTVIPNLSEEFAIGKFTVILSPSGCGKSTLLSMIAGLERVTSGKIFIGEREVQDEEPKKRGCAMVFQNYALYPHMTVYDNIVYSLKVARVPKSERQRRVGNVAELVGLGDTLERRPGQLSGGQRQRVAIARAIVREPSVLLLDEPMSNLDAQLRHGMRTELIQLHRRIGATSILVTHDQVEAMTLADKILVMHQGRTEQFGTPDEVYHHPANTFVASFIGAPPMNLFDVKGREGVIRLTDGKKIAQGKPTGSIIAGIRPESVVIDPDGSTTLSLLYQEKLGSHSVIAATLPDGQAINLLTPFGSAPVGGSRLKVRFPPEHMHFFDKETGRNLEPHR